jgi:hypothetical protein
MRPQLIPIARWHCTRVSLISKQRAHLSAGVQNRSEAFGFGHFVPITAETIDAAAAFGTLQHAIKRLDQLIVNMTDISDVTHELVAAERDDPEMARNYRRHCQARAYKTLQPILDAAIRQSAQIETELANFLKASLTPVSRS